MVKASSQRGYHHGDLREALLEAALQSIAAEGTEKLSLRALARDAGVSATAPYRHFPSKRCLLAALITRGFRLLEANLAAARDAAAAAPKQRLLAISLAYVGFALENPTSYELMFSTVLEDFSDYADLKQAAEASFGVVLGVLDEVLTQRPNPGLSVSQAGAVAWSAVHGVSSLLLFGHDHRRSDSSPRAALGQLEQDLPTALRLLMRGITG
ncbi:MAG: TetR/AcrR family transcriptional regulator [Pseudomonadales bacterium]